jgi:sugar phosphate isomerase/epimerase
MKFAICNETFQDWPIDKGFAFAAECGYTGVEIAPFTIGPDVREITAAARTDVRRAAEGAGLEIIGLHWLLAKTEGLHVTSPDPAVRRRTADYLNALVHFCADLGGRLMVFGSPQQRHLAAGVDSRQGIDYAQDVLSQVLPALEQGEVTFALEPLGPAETNFLVTTAEAVELVERIGSPHVRLHLDCKAMATESLPIPDLVRQYRQLLAHFHANDPNRQGPGFGTLDFRPVFQALGEIDYRGWVSVEVFDYSPGVENLAKRSIDYMRDCLGQLAG